MDSSRRGLTLIELLVVLAIVAALFGLLFPALQSSRVRSHEAVCKSNLRQLSLAFAQLHQTSRQLPLPPVEGHVGGWSYEILPFLEEQSLYDLLARNNKLSSLPEEAAKRPLVMSCPVTEIGVSRISTIEASHFVLSTTATRESWIMFDAPMRAAEPWLTGPEMSWNVVRSRVGSHHGGSHYVNADGAVRLYMAEGPNL